jgi:hypothetical protein
MHYTGFTVEKIAARLMAISAETENLFDYVYLLEAARLLVEQLDTIREGVSYGK